MPGCGAAVYGVELTAVGFRDSGWRGWNLVLGRGGCGGVEGPLHRCRHGGGRLPRLRLLVLRLRRRGTLPLRHRCRVNGKWFLGQDLRGHRLGEWGRPRLLRRIAM